MKLAFYSCKPYEADTFAPVLAQNKIEVSYFNEPLCEQTADHARGYSAVCCFVTDNVDTACVQKLANLGVKLIACRSTGTDHVDIKTANELGITVVNVPAYSPAAVAEFAVGLLLSISRKIHTANQRVRQANFSLQGQVGSNLQGKIIGVIGTGSIGKLFCKIMLGFGCEVIASDPTQDRELIQLGVHYVDLSTLFRESDAISLHCPLNADTHHIINRQSLSLLKPSCLLVNTGRGGLIDTTALLQTLAHDQIGAVALDVYEHEKPLFFVDRSHEIIHDEQFKQLLSYDNVLITGHQAYLSDQALNNIACITAQNIVDFEHNKRSNVVIP